jgi:hypothetical protein
MALVWAALLVGLGSGIWLMATGDMFGGIMASVAGVIVAVILYRRAAKRRA